MGLDNRYGIGDGVALDDADGIAQQAVAVLDGDILDEYGDEAVFGKPIHSDDRNNKKTYLSVNGLEKSQMDVLDFTKKAIDKLDKIGNNEEEREFLKELFRYLTLRNI